jgi:uncharacterized membrane protein YbhN (UPF0104 family)
VVVAVGFGAGVAVALALAANLEATLEALARFRWSLAPVVVAAVLANYALRFLKWHFYLTRLGIPLPWRPSVLVFLAGFTMAITPGKFGEVLKAVLVRDLTGTEVSRTASVVMAERLTDVAGFLILSAFGITALPGGPLLTGALTGALVAAVLAFRSRHVGRLGRRLVADRPALARVVEPGRLFLRAGRALLAPGILAATVALSAMSWFFECVALYVILLGLNAPIGLRPATFLYAFASLAGALSMLPGGLGVAEGSLTGLLVGMGTPLASAAAATLLVRAATLWLAVGLGIATLVLAFRGGPGEAERPT